MFCSETSCLTQLLKSAPCLSRSFSVSVLKLKSLILSELIFVHGEIYESYLVICSWIRIISWMEYLFSNVCFCLLCHYIQLYTYWWPHWAPVDSSKSELIRMALVKQKRSSNQTKSHENLGNGPVRIGGRQKRCWRERVIRKICVFMKLSKNKINSQEKKKRALYSSIWTI